MTYKAILLAATFSTLAPVAMAAEPLVPIESFAHEADYSMPRLSPDGKHIAVNVRIKRNGRMIPTMSIYSLPDLGLVSTIAMNGYEIPVDFQWITNTRLIVSKGLVLGAREKPIATGELVSVDFDGKRQEYLYGHENFKYSSRGQRYGDDYGYGEIAGVQIPRSENVFVGTYLWRADRSMLYDIHSFTAIRKLVADIGARNLNFLVQNDKTPRFAYGIDDDFYPILYRFEDAAKEWKVIDNKTLGSRYYPLTFTSDDKELFALHSAHGGPTTIVRETVDGKRRTVVAEDKLGSMDYLQYTAMPSTPFAAGSMIGIPKLHYLDDASAEAKLHKELSLLFPGQFVRFINFTDDGKKLLFHVMSDRDPGSYYLFDRTTKNAALLFSNMELIDPEQMSERRPIQFKARDGLELTGYLTLPKTASKSRAPMVVMPHGGPMGIADEWFFDTDAQFLASRGYAVLQVNFRGSGGRGPDFEISGRKQWGGKMMEDLVDGVKWAGKLPEVDGSRVCSYGASFGGYASLMLPAREPGMFKCAIGYAGAYDMHYVFDDPRVRSNKGLLSYYKRSLGTDKDELTRYSPSMQADKIKVPVLLVHGSKDEICPPVHAERMRDALIKAGRPPEWMMVDGEGHGFYDVEHRRELYAKMEAFLGKHLAK